jgi:hypothetical protein
MGTKPDKEKKKMDGRKKTTERNRETLLKHKHEWKKADWDKKRIKNRN